MVNQIKNIKEFLFGRYNLKKCLISLLSYKINMATNIAIQLKYNQINKRFMLNRLNHVKNAEKLLTLVEKNQLAKAALALNKIITKPNIVHELIESSKIKIATATITKQSLNEITDDIFN